MQYIENDRIKVAVADHGAELCGIYDKKRGHEVVWQADPKYWNRHAPVLFPFVGKVCGGQYRYKGVSYPMGQHGFAREKNHAFLDRTEDTLRFVLTDDAETMTRWPYKFRLISSFRLEKDTVYHTLTVENQDTEPMPFGVGYHPAFAVPFDAGHTFADYVLRFSEMESPLCVSCLPHGLVTNQLYSLGSNLKEIPVDESLFANDSHCMLNLRSQTLGLYEKDTGRAVICDISQFPYTLLWSKAGKPHFVCIEPWMSLPSPEGGSRDWSEKPAAYILRPGQSQSITLPMRFV
jgi:aldose 1-epimerase